MQMPMTQPLLALLMTATALSLACGPEATGPEPEPEPEGGATDPVWEDAPEALALIQGQWLSVPLTLSDPQDDDVDVTFAGDNLRTVVDGETLLVRAGYDTTEGTTLTATLTDEDDNSSTYDIAVSITAFAWQPRVEWQGAEGPEPREHATSIYDAASNSVFVFGGTGYNPQFVQDLEDYWRYDVDTQTWSEITPTGAPPVIGASRRFAGEWGSGTGMLFGGYGGGMPGPFFDDLYRVSVENGTLDFAVVAQSNTPDVRSLHGFAYDAQTERYFLYGGVNQDPGFNLFGDTWSMTVNNGTAEWTELDIFFSPPSRYGFFSAVDETSGRWFIFGGAGSPSGQNPVNPHTDTWALDMRADPPAWASLDVTSPPGRRNGCGIADAVSRRFFVLGGTPDAMTTAPGVFALDMTPGQEQWDELPINDDPPNQEPLRSSGFGFSDGERTFCGFGNGDAGVHTDWLVLGPQ